MRRCVKLCLGMAGLVVGTGGAAYGQTAHRQAWALQLGTDAGEEGVDLFADPLGVFMVGSTAGSLAGPVSGGNTEPVIAHNPDAFILRFDLYGTRLWGAQVGDVYTDRGFGVSGDPLAIGGAYLTGSTGSNLDGANRGGYDQFLTRFSPTGQKLWTRQIGTGINDAGLSVSADAFGSVFVGGNTFGDLAASNTGINKTDATLSRYDSAGNLIWTRQWGQEDNDSSHAVTADGQGGVFVAGDTRTFLNANQRGFEATLRRYDRDGNLTWSRTLGTEFGDQALGISPDGHGGVYISGRTEGNLAANNPTPVIFDPFLARYDGDGNLLWTRQIPLPGQDFPHKVSADGKGGVYITGSVIRELPGHTSMGGYDAYVAYYNEAGELLWTNQFGTSPDSDPFGPRGNDTGIGIAADGLGAVYVTGSTDRDLFGPNAGLLDAFVVRFDNPGITVPEPAGVIAAIGLVGCLVRRRRSSAG